MAQTLAEWAAEDDAPKAPPKKTAKQSLAEWAAEGEAVPATTPTPDPQADDDSPLARFRAFQQGERGDNVGENILRGLAGFIPTTGADVLKMFSPEHAIQAAEQFGTEIGTAFSEKRMGQFVKENPVEVAAPILGAVGAVKGGRAIVKKVKGRKNATVTPVEAEAAVQPERTFVAPDPALPREFPEVKAPTRLTEVETFAQEVRGSGGIAPEPNVIGELKQPVGKTSPARAPEFAKADPPMPSAWVHLPEEEFQRRVRGTPIRDELTPIRVSPEPKPPTRIGPLESVAIPEPPAPQPLASFEITRFPTFKPVQEAALAQRIKATEVVRKVSKNIRKDPEGAKLNRVERREAATFANSTPESLTPKRLNQLKELKDYAITSVSSRFRQWGQSGENFAAKLERAEVASDRQIANDMVDWKKIFRKMSEQEATQVDEVMRGAPTTNPRIQQAAVQAAEILEKRYGIPAELMKLPVLNPGTGKAHPFQRMTNYAPQIHTERSIKKWSKPHERQAAIEQLRRVPRQYRGGGIQFSRAVDVSGYERDPRIWGPMYFRRSAKRLAQAVEFGVDDGQAKQLLDDIQRTHGGEAGHKAARLWAAYAQPNRGEFSGLVGVLQDAATISMLTTTGVLQAGQLSNTIAREGFLNTLRGMNRLRKPGAIEALERTGATVGSIVHDISPDGRSIGAKWATVIGLALGDRSQRLMGAAAAQMRAEQVARALGRGKVSPGLMIDAKRLGFTREQAITQKGNLTPEQYSTAGQRGANNTQFASRFIDLPEWRNNDFGRVLGLFKTFALQSGRFAKDLVKDAKDGHWTPLLRFTAASVTWNAALGEAIRALKGNEAPDNPIWRYLEDITFTVSLGTFQDLVRAALQGSKAVGEYFAGPVFGEGYRYAGEIGKAAQGEPEELQRHLLQRTVRRIPVVGPQIYENVAP